MRIMGLDLGTKRIGVALSDESGTIATGIECIEVSSEEKTIDKIRSLTEENSVGRIVVGHPLNMDGTSGERAKNSEEFASKIREKLNLTVVLWDERLTTKEAENVTEVLWHSTQEATFQADGSAILEFRVDGLGEITWWILSYGDQVQVLAPKALRQNIKKIAENMLILNSNA